MTPQLKNRLMMIATLAMLGAAAFILARNEELIFRDKGELTVTRDESDPDTLIFVWRDQIEAPMARRFEEAWRQWGGVGNRVIIDLHSPGGVIAEGADVIRVIERMKRTHQVDTRIRARRACYSMCVPIYLHGEERFAAANARFMFHEPSAYDFYTGERVIQPKFEREMVTRKYFNLFFVNSPITPAWRDRLEQEWKGRDLYYTGKQLVDQDSNIVTVLE